MSKNVLSAVVGISIGFMAIALGFIFFSDDSESDESSEPTTTTTTLPNHDSVSEGPYQEGLLELAQHFDLEPYGSDWNFSEVLGGTERTIRVKTGKGIVSLYPADTSDSASENPCSGAPANFLPLMANKGDIIVWDNTGKDLKVCPGEIFVVATQEEVEALAED